MTEGKKFINILIFGEIEVRFMKKNYKILSLLIISIIIFSCILSACSNGFNMNLEFKDADLLAISYDRLENADLSFNFSMEKSVYESNVEMNYANTEKTDVIVDYSVDRKSVV